MFSCEAVSKTFRSGFALQNITLRVSPGECVGILGANGSGKTALLRCCALVDHWDAGTWALDDVKLLSPPREFRGKIQMVFQNQFVFPHLLVKSNFSFRPIEGLSVGEQSRIIDQLQLRKLLDRPAYELSTGQRQRVAIARALLHTPRLLVLDEPFSALDVEHAEVTRDIVRSTKANGTHILISSHAAGILRDLCDQYVFLHEGKVLCSGPLQALARHQSPIIQGYFRINSSLLK